jgi:nitrite reductase/ring-hydroxylating ferredoxin subunit
MALEKTWFKIAESLAELDFGNNQLLEIDLGERKICLANTTDGLRACANKCPHTGADLSDGRLDLHGHLVCPWHRYRFSLKNGFNVSGEGYFLKTFAVETREDGVWVGV